MATVTFNDELWMPLKLVVQKYYISEENLLKNAEDKFKIRAATEIEKNVLSRQKLQRSDLKKLVRLKDLEKFEKRTPPPFKRTRSEKHVKWASPNGTVSTDDDEEDSGRPMKKRRRSPPESTAICDVLKRLAQAWGDPPEEFMIGSLDDVNSISTLLSHPQANIIVTVGVHYEKMLAELKQQKSNLTNDKKKLSQQVKSLKLLEDEVGILKQSNKKFEKAEEKRKAKDKEKQASLDRLRAEILPLFPEDN